MWSPVAQQLRNQHSSVQHATAITMAALRLDNFVYNFHNKISTTSHTHCSLVTYLKYHQYTAASNFLPAIYYECALCTLQ